MPIAQRGPPSSAATSRSHRCSRQRASSNTRWTTRADPEQVFVKGPSLGPVVTRPVTTRPPPPPERHLASSRPGSLGLGGLGQVSPPPEGRPMGGGRASKLAARRALPGPSPPVGHGHEGGVLTCHVTCRGGCLVASLLFASCGVGGCLERRAVGVSCWTRRRRRLHPFLSDGEFHDPGFRCCYREVG
jgi:hypothetical protein